MKPLHQKLDEVFLCKGKGCCPRLKRLNKDELVLTDDEGVRIILTPEQIKLLPVALSQLNDDD